VLQIPCPFCGPREEIEFHYAGQAHLKAPREAVDDVRWSRYLYFRDNPVGRYTERWVHSHGCRRWINLVRDTMTHEITAVYLAGERPEDAR
jgi:heterotetrameric sarcosine oxidase delta subunit